MDKRQIPNVLMALSLVFVAFAVIGMFGFDIYLASTQQMLVAIFLAVAAVYTKLEL